MPSLSSRFRKLTFWNKLAAVGATASVLAIPLGLVYWVTSADAALRVNADNDSIAAGRDITISELVTAVSSNEKFATALRAARRKWPPLKERLVNYSKVIRGLGGISFDNIVSKCALVYASAKPALVSIESFVQNVETAHEHANGLSQMDSLLDKTHRTHAEALSIEELFRSLESVSARFDAATGTPAYQFVRDASFQQRDDILKSIGRKLTDMENSFKKLRQLMAEIEKSASNS